MSGASLRYITATQAAAIDAALMSPRYGFSLAQLMELAGLSVAQAVYKTKAPVATVVIVCGPGNNGGDGLVAARHLKLFGYHVRVVYPRQVAREPFSGLVTQLRGMDVEVSNGVAVPDGDIVLDCVFGFSFRREGGVRSPFREVIDGINRTRGLLVSVDVPSGWDVGGGDREGGVREPGVLISLTAPKGVAAEVGESSVQYVGGRFIPPSLQEEIGFDLPVYNDVDQVVRVNSATKWHRVGFAC
eukprot:GFKZ01002149.1.p1 GENE.GFKZ01002149.1~~GFKZ01002149.1.p1  ORF type:complete len:283 (-),score=27.68 GFKZ01002149.1:145-876(-)